MFLHIHPFNIKSKKSLPSPRSSRFSPIFFYKLYNFFILHLSQWSILSYILYKVWALSVSLSFVSLFAYLCPLALRYLLKKLSSLCGVAFKSLSKNCVDLFLSFLFIILLTLTLIYFQSIYRYKHICNYVFLSNYFFFHTSVTLISDNNFCLEVHFVIH